MGTLVHQQSARCSGMNDTASTKGYIGVLACHDKVSRIELEVKRANAGVGYWLKITRNRCNPLTEKFLIGRKREKRHFFTWRRVGFLRLIARSAIRNATLPAHLSRNSARGSRELHFELAKHKRTQSCLAMSREVIERNKKRCHRAGSKNLLEKSWQAKHKEDGKPQI